jgi:ribosomal protein S18 acetylase RimI-like enzyme
MDTRVRYATVHDSKVLAELSEELGYPITPDRMHERLAAVLDGGRGAVLVAEGEGRKVIGWISVMTLETLTTQRRAHVTGLIVSRASRSRGTGRQLLAAAEEWARRTGCQEVVVRSRVSRERAHGFYLDRGYELVKTQHLFRRSLVD